MRRSEFLTPKQRLWERIRKWIAFLCLTWAASIFWATVIGGVIARYWLGASENITLFYVVIPLTLILILFFLFNREKYFRLLGFDETI